jgi:hypothetical protein
MSQLALVPFHKVFDYYAPLFPHAPAMIDEHHRAYVVSQERDLSYAFHLHQHPYVKQLSRRLNRDGLAGLQGADTDYLPANAALPASVVVALAPGSPVVVSGGAALVELPPGAPGGLPAPGKALAITAATAATSRPGARATLVDGMPTLPAPGAQFPVPDTGAALALGSARVELTAAAAAKLPDATVVTLPPGTAVQLTAGAPMTIAPGTTVTLVKSLPTPALYGGALSPVMYAPTELVQRPYPVLDLDFSADGAYAAYNWELFFHVPLTIALHLSRNQRFAEAQRWLHFIFDPTDDSERPAPERYWKVRPFHSTEVRRVEEILINLTTGADPELRAATIRSIDAWKSAPFRPHVVARYRQQAYMFKAVMAYLDNLIAWGDSLFRQDTGEAIDEALQLYVLAANLLGPRPVLVPKRGTVRSRTYANLRADLDRFGNALQQLETGLLFDVAPFPTDATADEDRLATLSSLGKALYFCVPRNDKLLGYWDTVADRLFKIRNSLNIQGIFRQLPLFDPPIDPALLARAAAAGLDVQAVVSGLAQPLPLVRFQTLSQRAAELAQEVKSLGSGLLSAIEKEDGEAMAILRARHEHAVSQMVEHVKYAQLKEASKSREALIKSLALATQRYIYYERQLGRTAEDVAKAVPELADLDLESLYEMKLAVTEPELVPRVIEPDIARDLGASDGTIISSHEQREFVQLKSALDAQEDASESDKTAKILSLIPEFAAQVQPLGVGAALHFGGRALSTQFSLDADSSRSLAGRSTYEAGRSARIGSYARRQQDWAHQSNLAAGEITQIYKQLRAAQLRQAVADQELVHHRKQIEHAAAVEQFLNAEGAEPNGKRTGKAFYTWLKREVKGLYAQTFQLAFDTARKAERALQHELGDRTLTLLRPAYLTGTEGLLAGERLLLDIKRMETAYHDLNRREYELTKHVSLLQVDPLALMELRATGHCTVKLPEALFDLDGPGHYFRRIRSVAVSVPCVTGPYASVNCRLTLLNSTIRTTPVLREGEYAQGDEDLRFDHYFGSLDAIVTSTGQRDSGLFDPDVRDERYLPFERAGVDGEWQLDLPANPSKNDPRQFDYDAISDVVLHIRYTAREGGDLLRRAALGQLTKLISDTGFVRLFSVRHEFPDAWAELTRPTAGGARAKLALELRDEHYPYFGHGLDKKLTHVDLRARAAGPIQVFATVDATEPLATLTAEDGGIAAADYAVERSATEKFELFLKLNTMRDLWIGLTWTGS